MFIHGVFQLEACWFSPQCWCGIEWLYYQINLGAWLCSSNDFPVNFMYSSLVVIIIIIIMRYRTDSRQPVGYLQGPQGFESTTSAWKPSILTTGPFHPLDFIIKSFDVYSRQQLVLANARTNGSQSRFLQTLALQWCSAVSGRDQIPCPQKHPSMWSPVFEKMFTADFSEKDAKEIKLPGKKAQEIRVLLNMIYSCETAGVSGKCFAPMQIVCV